MGELLVGTTYGRPQKTFPAPAVGADAPGGPQSFPAQGTMRCPHRAVRCVSDGGRRKDSLASDFPLRGTGKSDKGIHQRARWFMHMPPACADMIRILPPGKKEDHPLGGLLFWLKIAILTKCEESLNFTQ